MATLEPALPAQLFLHSIGYADGKATVVTMHTPQGDTYYFQPIEDKQYVVMYTNQTHFLMQTTTLYAKEVPAVLETIFSAGSLDAILRLQTSRQLVECTHRHKK